MLGDAPPNPMCAFCPTVAFHAPELARAAGNPVEIHPAPPRPIWLETGAGLPPSTSPARVTRSITLTGTLDNPVFSSTVRIVSWIFRISGSLSGRYRPPGMPAQTGGAGADSSGPRPAECSFRRQPVRLEPLFDFPGWLVIRRDVLSCRPAESGGHTGKAAGYPRVVVRHGWKSGTLSMN